MARLTETYGAAAAKRIRYLLGLYLATWIASFAIGAMYGDSGKVYSEFPLEWVHFQVASILFLTLLVTSVVTLFFAASGRWLFLLSQAFQLAYVYVFRNDTPSPASADILDSLQFILAGAILYLSFWGLRGNDGKPM